MLVMMPLWNGANSLSLSLSDGEEEGLTEWITISPLQ